MSDEAAFRVLVANIAASYFRSNHVPPSEISTVIGQINSSLAGLAKPEIPQPADFSPVEERSPQKLTAARIRNSIRPDALISFEDNKPYRSLGRHLTARGLSFEQYRAKWGLPEDYPKVAASFRGARSKLAAADTSTLPQRAAAPKLSPKPKRIVTAVAEPQRLDVNVLPDVGTAVAELPTAAVAALVEVSPAVAPAGAAQMTPDRPRARLSLAQPTSALSRLTGTLRSFSRLQVREADSGAPRSFRPLASSGDISVTERHQVWLSMLTGHDWARIKAMARQVNPAHSPPVFTALGAPLRVRVCMSGQKAKFAEECVGTLRDGQVAVLIEAAKHRASSEFE